MDSNLSEKPERPANLEHGVTTTPHTGPARLSRTGFFVHLVTLIAGAGIAATGHFSGERVEAQTAIYGVIIVGVGFIWGLTLMARGRREKDKIWFLAFMVMLLADNFSLGWTRFLSGVEFNPEAVATIQLILGGAFVLLALCAGLSGSEK